MKFKKPDSLGVKKSPEILDISLGALAAWNEF